MSAASAPSVAAVALLAIGTVAAQTQPATIEGTWAVSFAAGGNPNRTVEDRSRRDEPPLRPQYLANWRKHRAEIAEASAQGRPLASPTMYCLPTGMPSMMGDGGPFPMEILISDGQVTIIQEAYNQVRRIYVDRPQLALADVEPGFFGRSVGHWDGDTLIVDTIGVKESVEFRNVPHSPQMRITERLSLVSADELRDVITIDDPGILERPWTVTFEFSRMHDYEMMEYVCEDNREFADDSGAVRLRID